MALDSLQSNASSIVPPVLATPPASALPPHQIDIAEFFEILPTVLLVVALSAGEALVAQNESGDEGCLNEAMVKRRRERLRGGMRHLQHGFDGFEAIRRS